MVVNPYGSLGLNAQSYGILLNTGDNAVSTNALLVSQPGKGNIAQFQTTGGSVSVPNSIYLSFQNGLGQATIGIDGDGYAGLSTNAFVFGSFTTSNPVITMVNGVGKLVVDSSSVYPFSNNAISLGRATNVWTNIYAQNGTIITSDERAKAIFSHLILV